MFGLGRTSYVIINCSKVINVSYFSIKISHLYNIGKISPILDDYICDPWTRGIYYKHKKENKYYEYVIYYPHKETVREN